jgi:hypothetical protein
VKPQRSGRLLERVFVNTHCLANSNVPSRRSGHSALYREGLVAPPTAIPSNQTNRDLRWLVTLHTWLRVKSCNDTSFMRGKSLVSGGIHSTTYSGFEHDPTIRALDLAVAATSDRRV